jgi:peptidyl-prolyl cis-trans isomerase C
MTFKPARLLALVLATATLPVMAQTLVTVNGKPIPSSREDAIVKQITARGQKDSPELRAKVKDQLIDYAVIAQEAEKMGLAKSDDVKSQLDNAKQQILIGALVQDHVKNNPVKEADIKAEYERIKATMPTLEYHARHILVDKEDDAKAIVVKLKGGAKFEDLAKESSKDSTASNGGDLDWGNPAGYVKPFSDALVGLKKGQFTETPVHTEFGYHIIKLEDTRPAKIPTYDELKQRISDELQQKELRDYVAKLRAKAKIQ